MKLVRETSPYIRKNVSVSRMMIDVLIALLPVVIFAIVQNGFKSVSVILISVGAMLLGEIICNMLIKWPEGMKFKQLFTKDGFKEIYKKYTINNITAPLISAIIYAMILPAGTNWYVVLVGAVVGIVVGKMFFGGLGSNIFNPAAVGRVFVGICFGSQLVYNNGGVDVAAGGTPLAFVTSNLSYIDRALSNYSLLDLFLGKIPGSMGEVSALMILIGAIYLFIRHSADIRATLSMLLSFAVITLVVCFVANSVAAVNPFELFLYEILSGGLLFGAVYMITDPVTSPTSKIGRIIYGVMVGSLTALIRYAGAYPEGVAFSILIANMFVPTIDHFLKGANNSYNYKHAIGVSLAIAVMCLILGFTVANKLGSKQIKEYREDLFVDYNNFKSDVDRDGFDSDLITQRIVVKNKEGEFLGYIYTTKYWVLNEYTKSYNALELLIGIDKQSNLTGVKILENTQSYNVQTEEHIINQYVAGINKDVIENLDLTDPVITCGATNSASIVQKMVLAAFTDCLGGAK